MIEVSEEKQEIVKCNSNTLVLANPGTGKTFTISLKYIELVKNGVEPKDILCLTFTTKAKSEMENRILKDLEEQKIKIDYSDLNVHTFHSYALDSLPEDTIASSNLLRYTIYEYLKKNQVLNYSKKYMIENIVPKLENLIRYVKSLGIMPEDIEVNEVNKYLDTKKKNISIDELKVFCEHFVNIFQIYEEQKDELGIDYADMLLNFAKLENKTKFKYVLIDELQDVSKIEAEIALASAETFVAVGDRKQAIFGFQGGSISNFKLFSDSKSFILTENRRSTNEILEYAKEHFLSNTNDEEHDKDLENFHNPDSKKGEKPVVYTNIGSDAIIPACQLAEKLSSDSKVAIIARTNYQILQLSKELNARGIEHSSTFFCGSVDAKKHIITFLNGMFSKRIEDIANSMFTPFFPISIQNAFEITRNGDVSLDDIYRFAPRYKQMREEVKTVEDIHKLFKEVIIPISITYGKDYVFAVLSVSDAFTEALDYLKVKNYENIIAYIRSSDILSSGVNKEKNLVVTTVHKAKGLQYDDVIYLPHKPTDKTNFADLVVEAIIKSKGMDISEEIEEDGLRIDFVAFTRAKHRLFIMPKKPEEYVNDKCILSEFETGEYEYKGSMARQLQAYNLFINKDYDGSKKLLETNDKWIIDFVKNYFDSIEHISFSSLTANPVEYLNNRILNVRQSSDALELGTKIHNMAECLITGEKYEKGEKSDVYEKNLKTIIAQILKKYPQKVDAEIKFKVTLGEIMGSSEKIFFTGKIDAVFKNDSRYLIVDWKTSKKVGSKNKQQLEAYKRAYSIEKNIPLDKIDVAVGYVGLRTTVNTGDVGCLLDDKTPAKSAFGTFCKKVDTILAWREDTSLFFDGLRKYKNSLIVNNVLEQYDEEKV